MSVYPLVRYEVEHGRVGADRGRYKIDSGGLYKVVPADAIVIDRAELPEVTKDGEVDGTSGKVARFRCDGICGFADSPPWRHRKIGITHFALAEYLDAHPPTPPVDEAQVEALAADLFAARWPGKEWNLRADPQQQDYRTMARTLIAGGWSK